MKATLYTLTRLCVFLALSLAPLLSDVLGKLSQRVVHSRVAIGRMIRAIGGSRS